MRQHLILTEVAKERRRQTNKWGVQRHPDGTNRIFLATASVARIRADRAAQEGRITWSHILTEEFYESQCETDETRLREELIQVAAVAVAWIEDLDQRRIGRLASGVNRPRSA